ncbi:MAG TPA: hypothetical protein VIC87_11020 [Vicinamibacteria bacterium]|jgi:hypothetical protein
MAERYLDGEGHLSPAGFAALARSRAGQAPADVAVHVASCARCQDLALAGAATGSPVRRERREPPPPWRIGLVVAAIVLLLISILITIHRLR